MVMSELRLKEEEPRGRVGACAGQRGWLVQKPAAGKVLTDVNTAARCRAREGSLAGARLP